MSIIVDTCVWSRFLRPHRDLGDPYCGEIRRLARRDQIAMLGAIRQEILSGAQPHVRFEQLKQYLRYYPNLPLDAEDDENAAGYYNRCRSHGIQGSATDLLICAVSVRYKLKILTTDTDFEFYAEHLPISLHRFRGQR